MRAIHNGAVCAIATMLVSCDAYLLTRRAGTQTWEVPAQVEQLQKDIAESENKEITKTWQVSVKRAETEKMDERAEPVKMEASLTCKEEDGYIVCADPCTVTVSFPLSIPTFKNTLPEYYELETLEGYYCKLDYLLMSRCDNVNYKDKEWSGTNWAQAVKGICKMMGAEGVYLQDAAYFTCPGSDIQIHTQGQGLVSGDNTFYQKLGFIHLGLGNKKTETSATAGTWEKKQRSKERMNHYCELRKKVVDMQATEFSECKILTPFDEDTGKTDVSSTCAGITVKECWEKVAKGKTEENCYIQYRLANRFIGGGLPEKLYPEWDDAGTCDVFSEKSIADLRGSSWALSVFDGFSCKSEPEPTSKESAKKSTNKKVVAKPKVTKKVIKSEKKFKFFAMRKNDVEDNTHEDTDDDIFKEKTWGATSFEGEDENSITVSAPMSKQERDFCSVCDL